MKVHVEYRIAMMGYACFFYQDFPDMRMRRFRLPNGEMRDVRSGELISDLPPTLMLYDDEPHALIEALQQVGVQPKQLTKVEGQHEAQSAHLADLQKILRKQGVME